MSCTATLSDMRALPLAQRQTTTGSSAVAVMQALCLPLIVMGRPLDDGPHGQCGLNLPPRGQADAYLLSRWAGERPLVTPRLAGQPRDNVVHGRVNRHHVARPVPPP